MTTTTTKEYTTNLLKQIFATSFTYKHTHTTCCWTLLIWHSPLLFYALHKKFTFCIYIYKCTNYCSSQTLLENLAVCATLCISLHISIYFLCVCWMHVCLPGNSINQHIDKVQFMVNQSFFNEWTNNTNNKRNVCNSSTQRYRMLQLLIYHWRVNV